MEIIPVVSVCNVAPAIAAEIVIAPVGTGGPKVTVPIDAYPIEFQSLHLKFRRCIFEIIARAGVVFLVQKIVNWINRHADIDRMRFQPHSF